MPPAVWEGWLPSKPRSMQGGGGKAGGVKIAQNPSQAEQIAGSMLGTALVTHQTGPEGRVVHRLLIEEGISIVRELYLGLVIDPGQY